MWGPRPHLVEHHADESFRIVHAVQAARELEQILNRHRHRWRRKPTGKKLLLTRILFLSLIAELQKTRNRQHDDKA